MNTKFYIDKFLLKSWITCFSLSIIFIIIYIILKFLNKNDNFYLGMSLVTFFIVLTTSKRAIQWVEIKENGIYAKSIFGLIKFSSWESINKIEVSTTLEGKLTTRYFIIFSNEIIKEKYRETYNRIYLNIRVPYNEKTEEIIKGYYNKEIIILPYETIVKRRKE